MKANARATNYQGEWRRSWFRAWIWNWEIARPYVWWGSLGLAIQIGVVIGYLLT